jgi:hypothetical protein
LPSKLINLLDKNGDNIKLTLFDVINEFNNEFNEIYKKTEIYGGTTCTICIIDSKNKLAHIINLGDSYAIILKNSLITCDLKFITEPHEANSIKERQRITNINANVKFCNNYMYLNQHKLMVTRTFGDYHLDEIINREGDYEMIKLDDNDLIILTSDGLFEKIINNQIKGGRYISEICEDALYAVQEDPSNISQILIQKHIEKLTTDFLILNKLNPFGNQRFAYQEMIENSMDNHLVCTYLSHNCKN